MDNDKLEQAIRLIELGKKSEALPLLAQVLKDNPQEENAWIWMAAAVDDPKRKEQCLLNALAINPSSEDALRELGYLHEADSPEEFREDAVFTAPFIEDDDDAIPSTPAVFLADDDETEVEGAESYALPGQSRAEIFGEPEAEVEEAPAFQRSEWVPESTGQAEAAAPSAVAPARRRQRSDVKFSGNQLTILIVMLIITLLLVCGGGGYILWNQLNF